MCKVLRRNACMRVCVCAQLCVCVLSCVPLCVTARAVAYEAPLSMEFPMQENWSGLPFPTPRNACNSH